MANSQAMCTSFKMELLNGSHAFGAQGANSTRTVTTKDVFKLALYLTSGSRGASDTVYSTTGELAGSGNYTQGGVTVTNATARDTDEIIMQRNPVACRGIGRTIIPGRVELMDVDVPVGCGGVMVRPGDIVGCDWDGCVVVGSFVPALLLGVAFANIFKGIPIDADGNNQGNLLTLLNPYGLMGGLLFVLLFLMHGSLWLAIKTEGAVHDRAAPRAAPDPPAGRQACGAGPSDRTGPRQGERRNPHQDGARAEADRCDPAAKSSTARRGRQERCPAAETARTSHARRAGRDHRRDAAGKSGGLPRRRDQPHQRLERHHFRRQ